MSTTEPIIVSKGEEICWIADWTDIARFFLFNYGLHALTVLSAPGAGVPEIIINTLVAIVLPFSGATEAIKAIYRFARGASEPLRAAQKAGALCMVITGAQYVDLEKEDDGYKLYRINPALSSVQGQHPVNESGKLRDDPGLESNHKYLVRVPYYFKVEPLVKSDIKPIQPQIACNYNVPKTIVAIIQVGYGSYGLWRASGRIVDIYGYAAYSLTVIPYILLSFVNLLANLCQPQYPSLFLVRYGGQYIEPTTEKNGIQPGPGTSNSQQPNTARRNLEEKKVKPDQDSAYAVDPMDLARTIRIEQEIEPNLSSPAPPVQQSNNKQQSNEEQKDISGEVGQAFRQRPKHGDAHMFREDMNRSKNNLALEWTFRIIFVLLQFAVIVGPYLVIQFLSNFEAKQSSRAQRAWLMSWLVCGQVFSAVPPPDKSPHMRLFYSFVCVLLVCPAAIGGLVVVGEMIRTEMICMTV